MGKFKEKLYRFMYGRYGSDDLYRFSLTVVLILLVTDIVLNVIIPEGIVKTVVGLSLSIVIFALYFWIFFRSMSRNIAARRRENMIYLKASRAVKRVLTFNTSRKTKSRNRDDVAYIFRDCTKCGATLRLPRNPGKHSVKCPKCSHSFYVKSK